MDFNVTLDLLTDVSFDKEEIKKEVTDNIPISFEFTNFVSQICSQIGQLVNTEETVGKLQADNFQSSLDSWKMELASFLRELQCPYDNLMLGETSDRLESGIDRQILVEFLASELIAAKKVKIIRETSKPEKSALVPFNGLLHAVKLSQPPSNTPASVLFKKIAERVQSMPENMMKNVINEPILRGLTLNESQWKELDTMAQKLEAEYALRRTMLITRLNATLQSFTWSDRIKKMPRHVDEAVSMTSFNNSKFSHITVADALAARKDLLMLNKIASEPPETRSSNALTKVKVGRVPDRGGRPSEMAAPPPEMPSWQPRSGQAHNAKNFSNQRGGGHGRNNDQRGHQGGGHQGGGYHGNGQGGGHHGGGGGGKNRNKHRGVQGAGWKRD